MGLVWAFVSNDLAVWIYPLRIKQILVEAHSFPGPPTGHFCLKNIGNPRFLSVCFVEHCTPRCTCSSVLSSGSTKLWASTDFDLDACPQWLRGHSSLETCFPYLFSVHCQTQALAEPDNDLQNACHLRPNTQYPFVMSLCCLTVIGVIARPEGSF